ncbi:MAG: long-chain acyl-CoA synthetase [Actinomycetota bacterium]|nr:long-chain acyl-CoA synthetase [Actinomycetota bacterium]
MNEHNLAELGELSFERFGDRDALWFEGQWHRSGELLERARRAGNGFQELGVAAGDRVVVMMSNTPDVGVCYGGLWRAGAAITPAIFLMSQDELHFILQDSEARAIVTSPEFLPSVKAAAEGVDTLKWILSTGPEEPGVIPLASLEDSAPGEIARRTDEDLAALMYTGGTTGRAKGVMLSHSNLWHAGKSAEAASHVPGITRTLIPLPLSHSYGLLVTVVGMHAQEPGTAVLMRWFDPAGWLELVTQHQIQLSALVPSMIQMLLSMPLEDADLSSLRYVVSGASPLPMDSMNEFERRVPGVKIREGYGLTESSAIISTMPPDHIKQGSVGVAVEGCEVKVVDDNGDEVPPGEIGEIIVRSGTVMLGYWRADDATRTTVRDGWLYTGDMGRLDEDGYLWIVDRKKDLIIRGGFNVYPRDVEDALTEHPHVAVAAVVGRPDETYGEEVVAFVQLVSGADTTAEQLVEFAKGRVGKYKYPREVRVVDSIPLTPVGKIDRKALRPSL